MDYQTQMSMDCFRKYIISAEEEIESKLMQNWQWSNWDDSVDPTDLTTSITIYTIRGISQQSENYRVLSL